MSETPDIDLAASLRLLRREFGIERLLLEGGGGINGSFFAAGLVDELSVIVAPALVGREGAQRIIASGEESLKGKVQLTLIGCETLSRDLLHLRYAVSST